MIFLIPLMKLSFVRTDLSGRKLYKMNLILIFQNNTWSFVHKPENKNVVDCRWVFSIKHDEFGN